MNVPPPFAVWFGTAARPLLAVFPIASVAHLPGEDHPDMFFGEHYGARVLTRADAGTLNTMHHTVLPGSPVEGSAPQELARPLAIVGESEVRIYPSLLGPDEGMIPGARWDEMHGCFIVPATVPLGPERLYRVRHASPWMVGPALVDPASPWGRAGGTAAAAEPSTGQSPTVGQASAITRTSDTAPAGPAVDPSALSLRELAVRVGALITPQDNPELVTALTGRIGQVPDWFGMELRPYQMTGALALAGGAGILGDEPGTGKTVMALATAAVLGAQRILVAAPGIAITHWLREAERTGLTSHMGEDAQTLTIVSGRKAKPLPERGLVVTTPHLLRDRARTLRREAIGWAPDLLIFDEAHLAQTWDSKISTAMREVAAGAKRSLMLTGTPLNATPEQVMPLLEMTGDLSGVFGGAQVFRERYLREAPLTVKNRYGRDVTITRTLPRREMLEEFAGFMSTRVWVRRTKAQVQKDLPPKVRSARIVDVDPAALRTAYERALKRVDEWLDELGHPPTDTERKDYRENAISLLSILREAAGLAKVPATIEHLKDWVESSPVGTDGRWPRPLIVWYHHRQVAQSLMTALRASTIPHEHLSQGLKPDQMGAIADRFQQGRVPVLLCSIQAVSTGVTLTAASDELFVETDWTNATISQAESRAHRHGQDKPVMIETMIAPGTLDASIQSILRKNATLLLEVTPGADVDVAVLSPHDRVPALTPQLEAITKPAQIIDALIDEALARRARHA